MAKTSIKIAAATNLGLVRTNNEDNFIVCPDLEKNEWVISQSEDYIALGKYGALLVVADGMGGANAGEVASEIAVQTVKEMCSVEALEKVEFSDKNVADFLTEIVKQADANIVAHSKTDEQTRGMGTTIVMAWIYEGVAHICWCGDSRCYVFNSNVGLQRLSKDHSYVQELVDRGDLDPENAFDHPMSNVITRCLGDASTRAVPDTRTYTLVDGDTLLLCTDGLSGLCHDEEILNILNETQEEIQICKAKLMEAALMAGGHDNVTVALATVRFESEEGDEEPPIDGTVSLEKSRGRIWKWLFLLLLLIIIVCIALQFTPYASIINEHLKLTK